MEDPYEILRNEFTGINVITVGVGAADAEFKAPTFDGLLDVDFLKDVENAACTKGELEAVLL